MGNHHGLLVALANEATVGDTIVTEKHSFISLVTIAELLHLKIVGLDADDEGLLPDAFKAACKRGRIKVVYCQPCVHNPTNATMSEDRRHAIVQIAQRHGVVMIEDEVTRPVASNPPPLLKSLAPELCYLLASPSKVLTPGIKIGYMVPPSVSKTPAKNTLRATMAFMGGLPSQILSHMIQDGTADKHIEECKREGRIRQKIAQENLPPDLVCTNSASYFVWLHLPECWPAASFAAELYRKGTPAWAAETYAVDPKSATRAVRFNIGQAPNQVAFLKSVQMIASLLETKPRHWSDG
jgi:DNA-binding transcriptional MocR family regulator